ncbi:MAG: HAMP domain-containing sensor histidine kinase [Ekhidna sp.]|uniref:sensor histidine kinase n=1 Tax=Ekhidna sp. TaxID=2608089 RepID=UPI0032EEA016
MAKQSYRKIVFLIVITAVVLTAAQVYFTIQNYQVNKQRFIQDVKLSLDASIEDYFANRAKNSIYILTSTDSLIEGKRAIGYASKIDEVDSIAKVMEGSKPLSSSNLRHVWSSTGSFPDSIKLNEVLKTSNGDNIKHFKLRGDLQQSDTSRLRDFQFLTQKVMISISEDLLDLGTLFTTMQGVLEQKNLNINFKLKQEIQGRKTTIGSIEGDNYLSAEATSTYLGDRNTISIDFENATLIILRNGISELVLSVLLIGLVIGTLIHLYQTINAQKQLAAIKDDLISNITHEFKTPIATIFSALEGVTNFNQTNDQDKTKRYLELSNSQLRKLNDMVEKMLETAIIDKGKLTLNQEELEVVGWTRSIVERFQLVEDEKQIRFETNLESHVAMLDRFHLENSLSNLMDNAIKYGGDQIVVRLKQQDDKMRWEVEDNGGSIPKNQREKIFEKLYRIPTGNTHDVKGFGIGLYYARTIAELHGGQLTLEVDTNKTLFKLAL